MFGSKRSKKEEEAAARIQAHVRGNAVRCMASGSKDKKGKKKSMFSGLKRWAVNKSADKAQLAVEYLVYRNFVFVSSKISESRHERRLVRRWRSTRSPGAGQCKVSVTVRHFVQ